MKTISELFGAKLQELQRIDEESNRKTQDTLKRVRSLIKEFEEMELETEY